MNEKKLEVRWQRDTEVTTCPICSAPFTLWLRRHHCRSCGKIYCDTCTRTRKPLKNMGFKGDVRLCDICAKDIALCASENVVYEKTNLTHIDVLKEWIFLVTTIDFTQELESKILRGIPNTLRALVWTELCHANAIIAKNGGIYEHYLRTPNGEADEPISHDLPRTILNHPRFGHEGSQTQSIANVLHAYANFDPNIGYAQGMGWVVAALLIHMNEETAFWVFVQMMKKYSLFKFFVRTEIDFEELERFKNSFRIALPNLETHIINHGCEPSMFALQWARSLFVPVFDLAVVFRLWDIFFVEKIDFFFNFVLTMFTLEEEDILQRVGPQTLVYINQLPVKFQNSDIEELIALSIKNHSSIKVLGVSLPLKSKAQKSKNFF